MIIKMILAITHLDSLEYDNQLRQYSLLDLVLIIWNKGELRSTESVNILKGENYYLGENIDSYIFPCEKK